MNTKVVLFIDCLGPNELIGALSSTYKGTIASGIPRVTPVIIANILTGQLPPNHGLLNPTPLEGQITKPKTTTLIEQVAAQHSTLNYEIPFTMGLKAKYLTNYGTAMHQHEHIPELNYKPIENVHEMNEKYVLNSHIAYISAVFSQLSNVIVNNQFRVLFVGIRELDKYGHFYHKGPRKKLIEVINTELEQLYNLPDTELLWFSDHGIVDKQHSFYINKWLVEHDWLHLDVLKPALQDKSMEMCSVHDKIVHVHDDSMFVSSDVFDCTIEVLNDDAPINELRCALDETKMIDAIYRPEELYGQGPYNDNSLVLDRAPGVLVSGNVHPDLTHNIDADNYCQGAIRTGVHSSTGCWGSNANIDDLDCTTTELYPVLKNFVLSNNKSRPVQVKEGLLSKTLSKLKNWGYV